MLTYNPIVESPLEIFKGAGGTVASICHYSFETNINLISLTSFNNLYCLTRFFLSSTWTFLEKIISKRT